jgi:hypothetical protein
LPRARLRSWILVALIAVLGAAALPASATASSRQMTIFQDDGVFLGHTRHDPNGAMAEAKALGVDVVRVFLSWYEVSPDRRSRRRPSGFDVGDPDSAGYNWDLYDAFIERARFNGLKVLLTLSPAIPYWASEEPRRCPHRIGGYGHLARSCMWKPKVDLFGQFAKAVARRYGRSGGRYGGQVALYSLWNEPNLEHYLYPQRQRRDGVMVDVAARRYRELWQSGWKAIAAYDRPMRNKVLFGETAAISSPSDTLYAALCLDEQGRPFRGRLRRLQGCSRSSRLPIGGVAVHPYNQDGGGSVFSRSFTLDSLPLAYLRRLHTVMDRAARRGRIPRGKGIYITEFGFQSRPPDRLVRISLPRHAASINEAERLFFADGRVKAIAQYELFDAPDHREFNTGLRLRSGRKKPAWDAFRMPLVASRLARGVVEVWGMVRPATGQVRPALRASGSDGFTTVARPLTNPSGYFRIRLRRANAERLRYRLEWRAPTGETFRSRVARPGNPIRYLPETARPRRR